MIFLKNAKNHNTVSKFSKQWFGFCGFGENVEKRKIIKENKNYIHHNIDIRNSQALDKLFKRYKNNISLIIHCAAQPSHDYGKNYPKIDFNVNATGTLNLLELTKKYCPNSPFIFMSTNKVYGDNPNKLKILEKRTRYELSKKNKFYNGVNENFSNI